MPRKPRLQPPREFFHVGARGNDKRRIFDDELRGQFLRLLGRVVAVESWTIYGWALMHNHYHVVLRTGDGGLSAGMHVLQTAFARASNARFGRIDHAFGKRFWSDHIEDESSLVARLCYVLWNPARVGEGSHPADSPWSSYRATVGIDPPPSFFRPEDVCALFAASPDEGRRIFVAQVDAAGERQRRAA